MIFPPLAADEPPTPSHLAIGDEVLHTLCGKTLLEAESQIAMTRLFISDINEALNAPLFGDSLSDSESPFFDESQLPKSESVYALFDPSSDFSVVPETAPIDLSPILRGVGETEARGGERRRKAAEAVTAEEMESESDSEIPLFNESQLPKSESEYALFDPSSDFSVVPETAPIDLSPILRGAGETRARGGETRARYSEWASVCSDPSSF